MPPFKFYFITSYAPIICTKYLSYICSYVFPVSDPKSFFSISIESSCSFVLIISIFFMPS